MTELGERYDDLGLIATGGMGQVRRVRDRQLDRELAMKIVGAPPGTDTPPADDPTQFTTEARITARLEHPGIVPIHEIGHLPDDRLYYTMPQVEGITLAEAVRLVHEASLQGSWQASPEGWSLRRLVDAFRHACDAVSFAHTRGVAHRDLKPDNVLLGAHGEVFVLDWGLALAIDGGGIAPPPGTAVGTPSYMPPERIWGTAGQDRAGDVYALGATLYEILTGGPPYGGGPPMEVMQRLAAGPPRPPGEEAARAGAPAAPAELVELVERALAPERGDRRADAGAVGRAAARWLEGLRRRDQAEGLVEEALELRREMVRASEEAAEKWRRAEEQLAGIDPWKPTEVKAPLWDDRDAAEGLQRRAARLEASYTQKLHAALEVYAELPTAYELLARFHRERHQRAEAAGDLLAAEREAAQLRYHDRAGAYAAYLEGTGTLSLETRPSGAQVTLYRHDNLARRAEACHVRELGRTPVEDEPLPMGSYLLRIRGEGTAEVSYPVHIDRRQRWRCDRPGAAEQAVPLPSPQDLGQEDCYVPGGWFLCGGDPQASGGLSRRRVWLDGFVIRRHPVTNEEFVAFLNDLRASGRPEEADRHVPRMLSPGVADPGTLLYGRDESGGYCMDGAGVAHREPVVWVTWHAAAAYAAWLADREGLPWRLPGELEWEKACRGVDGRYFPWGGQLDATWCNMRDSHPHATRVCAVDAFEADESPYGVRGMAGNVRDWCADPFAAAGPAADGERWGPGPPPDEPTARVGRGGAWCVNPVGLRAAYRSWYSATFRADNSLGFRLVRSFPIE